FVTAVRAIPVSVWVAVTSTPGSTAPLWSRTAPLICAVAWAQRPVLPSIRNTHAKLIFVMILFIPNLPWKLFNESRMVAILAKALHRRYLPLSLGEADAPRVQRMGAAGEGR